MLKGYNRSNFKVLVRNNRWRILILIFIITFGVVLNQKKRVIGDDILKHYSKDFIERCEAKYKTVGLTELEDDDNFIISMTTIPPEFQNLNINDFGKHKVYLNIPKTYKFYSYSDKDLSNIPKSQHVVINRVSEDFGPATKVLGLCSVLHELPDIKIVYLDSDVKYNVDLLKKMSRFLHPGYIFGNSGGFYVDWESQYSSMGHDLAEWSMLKEKKITPSEILYGFGAVILRKIDLSLICSHFETSRFFDCPSCFMIDDEYLANLYIKIGFKMISSRKYHPVVDVSLSDKKMESNRKYYKKLADKCLPCLNQEFKIEQTKKPKIVTPYIISDSLHPKEEIESMQRFLKHMYLFTSLNDLKFEIVNKQTTKKAHWMKIHIIRDFLKSCQKGETLFYTDSDFYFTSSKFPQFREGKSLIMTRGCSIDGNHLMVGNILVRCDSDLISLVDIWEEATKIMSGVGEINDDQIAFNLVIPRYYFKIQVEPIMVYDDCYAPSDIVGVHFPGRSKYDRLKSFID